MNHMETERKGKTPFTEKINTNVMSAERDKFTSMRPIFRARKRNGCAKPKCSFDQGTTTNIKLCSSLPK